MAEQLIRNEQVDGSIPFTSSIKQKASRVDAFCFTKIIVSESNHQHLREAEHNC